MGGSLSCGIVFEREGERDWEVGLDWDYMIGIWREFVMSGDFLMRLFVDLWFSVVFGVYLFLFFDLVGWNCLGIGKGILWCDGVRNDVELCMEVVVCRFYSCVVWIGCVLGFGVGCNVCVVCVVGVVCLV